MSDPTEKAPTAEQEAQAREIANAAFPNGGWSRETCRQVAARALLALIRARDEAKAEASRLRDIYGCQCEEVARRADTAEAEVKALREQLAEEKRRMGLLGWTELREQEEK